MSSEESEESVQCIMQMIERHSNIVRYASPREIVSRNDERSRVNSLCILFALVLPPLLSLGISLFSYLLPGDYENQLSARPLGALLSSIMTPVSNQRV